MRKIILAVGLCLGLTLVFLQYGYKGLADRLGLKSPAGIWVEANKEAQVVVDGKVLGKTPLKEVNLKEGEHQLEIKDSSSSAVWKELIRLNGGTLTVVNRDLDQEPSKTAGEVITLERGQGIMVTSIPGGAKVQIDGEEKGETPLFLPALSAGDHLFLISKDNFINRTVKAKVTQDYGLNLNVDLAQQEAEVELPASLAIQTAPRLKVLQTPTGFLRVRATPSTGGQEITRVSPGDELTLLEEISSSWLKIKTTDGKEGYVATQYIQKLVQ